MEASGRVANGIGQPVLRKEDFRLMTGKVPFANALVVIFKNNIIDVGNFVSPKIHRGNHMLRLAISVTLHHALFFEDLLQFAGLEHLADDVAAADELALNVKLRDRRPVRKFLDALAHRRVGEDVDAFELDAEMAEDLDHGRRETALRENRRAFHEEYDRRLADLLADAILQGGFHRFDPRFEWRRSGGWSASLVWFRSVLGCAGLQRKRVQLVAHPAAQRLIDQLVLLDPGFAAERAGDDLRGIVIAIAGKITDRHLGVGYSRLDQRLDIAGVHRHPSISPLPAFRIAARQWPRVRLNLAWTPFYVTPFALYSRSNHCQAVCVAWCDHNGLTKRG